MQDLPTLNELSGKWSQLSRRYRPNAFWFLNGRMAPEIIEESLAEMALAGIPEVIIHPIHGLEVDYLSDLFFDRYRLALAAAGRLGLKVWIYDEYGWPSGPVGGKLLAEHPEHRAWVLHFSKGADGGVTAAPVQSDRLMETSVGAPWTRAERGYLDMLSPEAGQCFIDMTHERYYRECREFFEGGVVLGFFTDEPMLMMSTRDDPGGMWNLAALPWTPKLPEWFADRFGYQIEPHYTALAGSDQPRVKRDYWTLVKDKHIEAFHGRIGAWCREHGVRYTGHLCEDHFIQQVRFGGSASRDLAEMDEPGVDFLGWGRWPDQRYLEQIFVASAARHAGRPRVFCEAYGISPWDLRPAVMLRQAQMMAIHGIDGIALMGLQSEIDGVRKRTYWPAIFDHAPWWEFYGELREAFARSVGLACLGRPVVRYAILYPQDQIEQLDVFTSVADDEQVRGPVETLARAIHASGESFEFVFPETLAQGRAESGRAVFPHASYEAILVPDEQAHSPQMQAVLAALSPVVKRGSAADLAASLRDEPPSWSGLAEIDREGDPADVRMYRFAFADGCVLALRNVTEESRRVEIRSQKHLCEWEPSAGRVTELDGRLSRDLPGRHTLYVSITDRPIPNATPQPPTETVEIEADWRIRPERVNLADLAGLAFRDAEGRWLPAEKLWFESLAGPSRAFAVPRALAGCTKVPFRSRLDVREPISPLGIVYEADHLDALSVNGVAADLAASRSMPIWDRSCRWVEIGDMVLAGENTIEGELRFEAFETTLANDAFFDGNPMPSCDLYAAGAFELIDNAIWPPSDRPRRLPIDLSQAGWSLYYGLVDLEAQVGLDESLASRLVGIEIETFAEDPIELQLDGRTVGRAVHPPFRFALNDVTSGRRTLRVRIASTAAAMWNRHGSWGPKSIRWLCRS